MQKHINTFTGTAKDFEQAGVTLNGLPLNQVAVNLLAAAQLIGYAGEGAKPARGKTPKMYRAVSRGEFSFAVPEESADLASVNV